MVNTLHRFVGESLITIAVVGAVAAALTSGGGTLYRAAQILGRVLVALLDLQWLLGVINYFGLPAGARPSLAHPVVMTVAVVVAHVLLKRAQQGSGRWGLAGVHAVTAVLLIVGYQLV